MEGRPGSLTEWNADSGNDALRDSLPDWVAHQANANPDRIALIAGDGEYSYGQLNSEVSATARKLASFGVAAGDRVATCLQNGACSAILPHAILRLGATLVPLNYRLSASELRGQLITVDARMLLVDRHSASRFAGSQDATEEPLLNEAEGMNRLPGANVGLPTVATAMAAADRDAAVSFGIPALEDATEADVPLRVRHDSGHILAIIHTSGTTGVARGAMLSVGNFWWSAIGSALNMGTQPDDRWLATLPLFHVGGLSILTRAAIYGIAAEIHDGFDAARVNAAIDTGRASIVSVVAVMLQRMLDERANKPYPPSLRCVLLGGGPAPLPLLERCSRASVPVAQTYGLTETTSQVATLAPRDALRKPGSAGRPIYPNEIRIDSASGSPAESLAAEPGAGEILVRGPVVMQGYLGLPAESASALQSGWLHTGDIGKLDSDGYLYVLDRRSDLIITGGENVYPAEVEAALLSHPAVEEAGVVGLPDDHWGQRVVAVVRLLPLDPSPHVDELRAHCSQLLAGYKVPAQIIVVSAPLPRTASGKLKRDELRQRLAEGEREGLS